MVEHVESRQRGFMGDSRAVLQIKQREDETEASSNHDGFDNRNLVSRPANLTTSRYEMRR